MKWKLSPRAFGSGETHRWFCAWYIPSRCNRRTGEPSGAAGGTEKAPPFSMELMQKQKPFLELPRLWASKLISVIYQSARFFLGFLLQTRVSGLNVATTPQHSEWNSPFWKGMLQISQLFKKKKVKFISFDHVSQRKVMCKHLSLIVNRMKIFNGKIKTSKFKKKKKQLN